jgi:hypothetical protein
MSKHTPGPWHAPSAGIWTADNRTMVASLGSREVVKSGRSTRVNYVEEHLANARLIAAAPELIAALQLLVTLKDTKPADYEIRKPVAWQAARDAIFKATGGDT